MTADVDVVIPVRNGGRRLRYAVDSVLDQEGVRVRVLVVDDGSADGAPSRLRDQRIVVLRNAGRGIPTALNTGIAAATAPYIARQDADDISLPGRLLAQVTHLAENEGIGLVATAYELVLAGVVRGVVYDRPARLLAANPICSGSVTARTDVLRAIGGFRAPFRYSEDYDCWLRCAQVSGVSVLPIVGYRYSISGNQSSIRARNAIEHYAALAQASARAWASGEPDPVSDDVEPVPADADEEFTAWWAREFAAVGAWRDSAQCLRRLPPRRLARELAGLVRSREPQVTWSW